MTRESRLDTWPLERPLSVYRSSGPSRQKLFQVFFWLFFLILSHFFFFFFVFSPLTTKLHHFYRPNLPFSCSTPIKLITLLSSTHFQPKMTSRTNALAAKAAAAAAAEASNRSRGGRSREGCPVRGASTSAGRTFWDRNPYPHIPTEPMDTDQGHGESPDSPIPPPPYQNVERERPNEHFRTRKCVGGAQLG